MHEDLKCYAVYVTTQKSSTSATNLISMAFTASSGVQRHFRLHLRQSRFGLEDNKNDDDVSVQFVLLHLHPRSRVCRVRRHKVLLKNHFPKTMTFDVARTLGKMQQSLRTRWIRYPPKNALIPKVLKSKPTVRYQPCLIKLCNILFHLPTVPWMRVASRRVRSVLTLTF
jgi:hypothetical protein